MSNYQIVTDERLAEILGAMTTALRGPIGSNSHLWPKFNEVGLLVGDLVAARVELADLRAYKERTEAGLHKLSGMVDHCGDVTEDEMRVHGLWRDPPQAEVQP